MPGPIGRQTVTLLEAAIVDGDYNTLVRDWDQAAQTPVAGCTVDYLTATRRRQADDQTTTRALLHLPPRAPQVTEAMRVQWDARTWDVDGVPFNARSAGPLGGQQVTLLEVRG